MDSELSSLGITSVTCKRKTDDLGGLFVFKNGCSLASNLAGIFQSDLLETLQLC